MDFDRKELQYRQFTLFLSGIMLVFSAVVLFLPPVRRAWDVGVVHFDMMTCYLALASVGVIVFGTRRKEKKLWGRVSAPPQPKTVLPFIVSLVVLCLCEDWLASFITSYILHVGSTMYESVHNDVCMYIRAAYFVILAVWVILLEAGVRSRDRRAYWLKARADGQ